MSLILIKRLVISLVALLQVLGLILIAFGIYFLYTAKLGVEYSGPFFIVLGSITIIQAIFGFFAAICESPVILLTYLGVLALMIRIKVVLINFGSALKDEIKKKIRQATAFQDIFVTDPTAISNMNILMEWLRVINTVCFLIILLEVVGAVLVVLLYRSVKKSQLAENPVLSS